MNTQHIPVLALALAVFIHLLLRFTAATDDPGKPMLSSLTLLVLAEFGFIVSLAGAYISGYRQLKGSLTATGLLTTLLCTVFAISLLFRVIELRGL